MKGEGSGQIIVALLPIKAHSQRVPGKNFREFHGRPLFRWVLDALLELPQISRVVIDTDAQAELAAHGLEPGPRVELRDRRADLRGDRVSMNRILADDVAAIPADVYAMTHATNPLLRAQTIRRAFETFAKARALGGADSLFAVNRVQARFYRGDASPLNHDPEDLIPTQDLEPWFEETSSLYLFTRRSFLATGSRIGRHPILFEMPRWESLDIDDADSWRHAELVAAGLEGDKA